MNKTRQKGFSLIELMGAMGLFLFLFLMIVPLIKCFLQEVPKKVAMANDEATLMSMVDCLREDVESCDKVVLLEDDKLVLQKGDKELGYMFTDEYVLRQEPWQADDPNDIDVSDWTVVWLKAEVSLWPVGSSEPKAIKVQASRFHAEDQPYYTFPVNHLLFLKGDGTIII